MKPRQIGLTLDGETIILQKFHGKFESPGYATPDWRERNAGLLKRAAGLDIETTGLDFRAHEIIELALRPFTYRSDTGELIEVEVGYAGLQQPSSPLTEEVTKITGLTDAMLEGQAIDWARVEAILNGVELVVAHNAGFDRPFVDRKSACSREKLWGCSLRQVDWHGKGFEIQKLGQLAIHHGFFVDAHRAMNDVNAMINLLGMPDESTGRAYLQELAVNAARGSATIYADRSPFESKDLLKARGYRWDAERRSWYRSIYRDELDSERDWLTQAVYGGRFGGTVREIPLKDQFAQLQA